MHGDNAWVPSSAPSCQSICSSASKELDFVYQHSTLFLYRFIVAFCAWKYLVDLISIASQPRASRLARLAASLAVVAIRLATHGSCLIACTCSIKTKSCSHFREKPGLQTVPSWTRLETSGPVHAWSGHDDAVCWLQAATGRLPRNRQRSWIDNNRGSDDSHNHLPANKALTCLTGQNAWAVAPPCLAKKKKTRSMQDYLNNMFRTALLPLAVQWTCMCTGEELRFTQDECVLRNPVCFSDECPCCSCLGLAEVQPSIRGLRKCIPLP